MKRPVCVFTRGDVALNVAHYIAASTSTLPPVMAEKCAGPDRKSLTLYVVSSPESEHDEVLRIVETLCTDYSDVEKFLIRCPECRSGHVEFPDRPHSSGTMQSLGWILEKLNEKVIHGPSVFNCEKCHNSWHSSDEETMRESGALETDNTTPVN